jgi:hypothetical protein
MTRKMGLGRGDPSIFLAYSWCFPRRSGESTTFPGLYTPWTFPNAAAIENMSPTLERASYTA